MMSTAERDSGSMLDTKNDTIIEESRDSGSVPSMEESQKSMIASNDERKLVRKLDMRILPIICSMYFFAFLDRTNLGNARLQGLPEDALHGDPSGKLYDWIFSAFFFSYILCQIPAVVLSKLFPPRFWLGGAAIGWGTCSTLMSTGFNFIGLVVARVALGVFETGFAPGMPLYLSYFYTKHEIGLRLAIFQSFSAVAGAFGGLVAFAIQDAHTNIANWRLLFIVEGVPAVFLGFVALILLPDRPEQTAFLNEEERKLAIERMNRAISGDVGFVVKKPHIWAALKDWRIYVGGIIFFSLNCAIASISAFLPTIIKTFGFTNAKAQLLTVPPYVVAAIVLTFISYASDRAQHRGFFMWAMLMICGIGYLLLLVVQNNEHVRYFAVFCITIGSYTTIGLVNAWYAHNLGSETKRATGLPMFMAIGQCGSILGSHLFPSTEGPFYIKGFAVSCALEFFAAICVLILSFSYFSDNRRRDRLYGKPEAEAKVDMSELADKAAMFRYLT